MTDAAPPSPRRLEMLRRQDAAARAFLAERGLREGDLAETGDADSPTLRALESPELSATLNAIAAEYRG